MPKKSKLRCLPERDVEILKYLWRWKFVSSSALHAKFFSDSTEASCYIRLRKLRARGLINSVLIQISKSQAWTLGAQGFNLIKEDLPEMESEGFKSEYCQHDFVTSAVHLGDWFLKLPEGYKYFSEQQLRRYPQEFYPHWIPKCDYYRPDGYWYLKRPKEALTISLEVELNLKKISRYDKIKKFYDHYKYVNHVIWVVKTMAAAKRLMATLNDKSSREKSLHQILLLKDVLKKNWAAPIILGTSTGTSLHDFMGRVPERSANVSVTVPSGLKLVDTRLFLGTSKGSRARPKTKTVTE